MLENSLDCESIQLSANDDPDLRMHLLAHVQAEVSRQASRKQFTPSRLRSVNNYEVVGRS